MGKFGRTMVVGLRSRAWGETRWLSWRSQGLVWNTLASQFWLAPLQIPRPPRPRVSPTFDSVNGEIGLDLYGASFDHIVSPSKPINGVIRLQGTGRRSRESLPGGSRSPPSSSGRSSRPLPNPGAAEPPPDTINPSGDQPGRIDSAHPPA